MKKSLSGEYVIGPNMASGAQPCDLYLKKKKRKKEEYIEELILYLETYLWNLECNHQAHGFSKWGKHSSEEWIERIIKKAMIYSELTPGYDMGLVIKNQARPMLKELNKENIKEFENWLIKLKDAIDYLSHGQ